VALFEMCSPKLGCNLNFEHVFYKDNLENILFGEDQSRYIFTCQNEFAEIILQQAKKQNQTIK
jgi:phosphoribosylformylglycinamidine (FGAM) synthase-like enzyme